MPEVCGVELLRTPRDRVLVSPSAGSAGFQPAVYGELSNLSRSSP
jgi:hypothetical protein